MSAGVRWAMVALLTVHGLIHLLGTAKAWGWAPVKQLKEPISPTLGCMWLIAAVLVLTAAAMIAARAPSWWWAVAVAAAVASQAVIVTSWADAKAGTAANVVLVLAAMLGFAASGPGSFAAQWDHRVDLALTAAPEAGPVVTENDLASLPAPLATYLRRSGVLGNPRVTSFAATVHGRIRSGPDTAWMPFTGRQVNTFGPNPQRLFYLDAVRGGLPVTVFHDYHDATATMRGKVLSLFPVLDASGPVMAQGETVTVFNDMVVFAPAALLNADVTWTQVDDHTVRGRFTNGIQTVSADLVFAADGDLATFTSTDRSRASADGTSFTRLPWDTPISGYRNFGDRRVAVSGEGRWNAPAPDGHFTYIEFHIDDIAYNLPPGRDLPAQAPVAAAGSERR
jgi:hypothetical protein